MIESKWRRQQKEDKLRLKGTFYPSRMATVRKKDGSVIVQPARSIRRQRPTRYIATKEKVIAEIIDLSSRLKKQRVPRWYRKQCLPNLNNYPGKKLTGLYSRLVHERLARAETT